nr:ATP synthase F0 subunit 8 [Deroploa parva]QVD38891.1 ATP synthase F0 subunit 8 [Deroploa parva]
MPQMAPMWWEILFVCFILSFLMVNVIIYFNMNMKINMNKNMKKSFTNMNWMW